MREILVALTLCLSTAGFVPAAAPVAEDFNGTFEDTVIQVLFVKVGSKLNQMHLSDSADTRMFLTVGERFVAEQRVAFSVFRKADYRVTFWGAAGQLAVRKAEPLDEPAGKGYRLTYEDGTIVEIIA
ncbi:MAG TPA: hypothetical protein VJU18_15685 [Vicinamibacteria bacterium]|nr:hypothetical protein [Vicinamibacteria bacterium]